MTLLPTPRGTLTAQRSLADLTWLRVGGPADYLFQPAKLATASRISARFMPRWRATAMADKALDTL